MNKVYLLVICLLLAPFTGCLDEFTDEEITSESVEDETDRECLVPYGKCYGVDFSDHDLSGMNLTGIRFSHTRIPGENGAADEWIQPNLSGADLSDTDLNDAEFYGIKLSGAVLTGANLHLATLINVDFRCANLTGANLTGANLTNAYFSTHSCDADLSYTDFTDAIVTNADFGSTYWYQTIWTDGVAYDGNQAD